MLKIKDGIDLKELEKFGFEPQYFENKNLGIEKSIISYTKKTTDYEYRNSLGNIICKYDGGLEVFVSDRSINLITEHYVGNNGRFELDLIYDLIQAGFVEKISNK